ncbi:PREDICTED: LOW QUALITY PROTEIN: piggyBac transposable element-derived protein 4-like [Priapulus caudatus]|uniref:LOW QUALITY PROTEIN: piggyBac transposable element-derived protein 4-like n=1 Tax=Priapulus caudatus TaxID=37621 RepID=A0ABM1EBC0_PRICU|nr:PREDICTED: LOW QUALITY PROTEIN: piggyBac transposable element-derived protein 4-like [Priapulus caudatus]
MADLGEGRMQPEEAGVVGYIGDQDLTDADPLTFLSLFLSDHFWDILVLETNRYAQQYLEAEDTVLKPKSRYHDWYEVTIVEMKAFFALHLAMGLVDKAELTDYWQLFWLTETPGFNKVMPRNRFQIILSFLHFVNNDDRISRGEPGHDRLFKIRPIIEEIVPRFKAMYSPRKELSLDEITVAFKERSTLKQYNPRKLDKYGYKAFVLSEAGTGYVLEWSMYTGQEEAGDPDNLAMGATHLTVRNLVTPQFTGKGHEVYMDSYYTSLALANELADNDTEEMVQPDLQCACEHLYGECPGTALLEGHRKKEFRVGRPAREMLQRLVERHWLDEVQDRPDCVVCADRSRSGGRRQTKYRCRQCGAGLCVLPCNERYHTLQHYKQCHLDR